MEDATTVTDRKAEVAATNKEGAVAENNGDRISLLSTDYQTIDYVTGPLIFVSNAHNVSYGEMVTIELSDGRERSGQVLEVNRDIAVIQVFEGTQGVDVKNTKVRFREEVAKIDVSIELLGRVLNGVGRPIDGGPPILPEQRLEIIGEPINPYSREEPADFIQTGISTIDGLNTLVRGQKLPIFSGSGLPANELTAQIIRQATVKGGEKFAIVFGAMGITHREASFFQKSFEKTGALERVVFFLNLADDPTTERIITPRCALTVAEYLAFTHEMQVLVVLTDMTNYCEALREISTAREEVPGRRGYPGYMYTDLSTLYERAGRVKGKKGSITQLLILTMPDDDITHPIPDLTGYITEGQIVLSRHMHRRGIFPPVDVLPSLSRLMNLGIGDEKTREDHRNVADQLYAAYAQGRDLRRLVAIVGEEALSEADRRYLKFADDFEDNFVSQGDENRDIERTLGISWDLLSGLPIEELKRIKRDFISKYHPQAAEQEQAAAEAEAEKAKAAAPEEPKDTDAAIAERLKKAAEQAAAKAEEAAGSEEGDGGAGEDSGSRTGGGPGTRGGGPEESVAMAAKAADEEAIEAEAT
ncbi:MAG: V-type ATP synthase subunit B [Actinobacteria bacterium]|nr:MAG: V-type ATP synthase subunit B [Actinomycetota bacterium]